MIIDQENVKIAYEALNTALLKCAEFKQITNKKVSIRGIEDKFGEYLIAYKLICNGFKINKIGGRGVDIIVEDKLGRVIKIEVKTSRSTKRFNFKGAKKGYAWVVKKSQWVNKEYDFLACVLADKKTKNIIIFTYNESIKCFSHNTFIYSNTQQKCEDCLRLDLSNDYKSWGKNIEIAEKNIKMEGKVSDFEERFNKNPEPFFDQLGFDNFIKNLNGGVYGLERI